MKLAHIRQKLSLFSFVQWDRFVYDEGDFTFYGWIVRPDDTYKDFMVLHYDSVKKDWWHLTSSASMHAVINELMGLHELDTEVCRRVEWAFDIKNCIRL